MPAHIPFTQRLASLWGQKTRPLLEQQIRAAQDRLDKKTTLPAARLALAQRFFEAGDFGHAREILQPVMTDDSPAALWLMAHLEYLSGRYEQAEALLLQLRQHPRACQGMKTKAELGLVFVYYQANRYALAGDLFKDQGNRIKLPLWEMMKAFTESPYQLTWNGAPAVNVPFIQTDPLPVIAVAVNGKPINALIDTGGDCFYLDNELASSLGIRCLASEVGFYAGGKKAAVGYAKLDSLQVGDLLLRAVPLRLGAISRFSTVTDNTYPLHGVLGTGVLHQFLATLDYPRACLTLLPKGETGRSAFQEMIQGRQVTKIPFVLSQTHLLIAHGTLNEQTGLAFLVDSGLADTQAAMLAPRQTLHLAGIAVPRTEKIPAQMGGLGGGGFKVGRFPVKTLGLGPLRQYNQEGLYGVFPPQLYWGCEFIIDGLISHQFLKRYAWSIDFTEREMIFSE